MQQPFSFTSLTRATKPLPSALLLSDNVLSIRQEAVGKNNPIPSVLTHHHALVGEESCPLLSTYSEPNSGPGTFYLNSFNAQEPLHFTDKDTEALRVEGTSKTTYSDGAGTFRLQKLRFSHRPRHS